jgi:hypothetical protein
MLYGDYIRKTRKQTSNYRKEQEMPPRKKPEPASDTAIMIGWALAAGFIILAIILGQLGI